MGSPLIATLDNGGTGLSGEQDFTRTAASGDLHLLLPAPGGEHELQAGFWLERQHEESTANFANGGFAREEAVLVDPRDPTAGVRPFWREVWDVAHQRTGLGTSDDLAIYLQDRWRPFGRLLVAALENCREMRQRW